LATPIEQIISAADNGRTGKQGDDGRIVQEIRQAFRDGKHERGCAQAHAAIEAGMRDPSLYYLRALCRGRREEYQQSLVDFESALALSPDDPVLLEATGHCLTMLGRFPEAVGAFNSAIAVKPDFARAHYRKGVALGLLNEIDDMRTAHRRVVELEPRNADALASLAFIAARKDEAGEVRACGERALAISPRHGIARVALAMADIQETLYAAAEEKLAAVLGGEDGMEDGRLNMALGFAADALDRHGRYPEAFHLYGEVNARRRKIHEARFAGERATEDAAKLIEAVRRCEFRVPDKQSAMKSTGGAGHVFLLGFVRSGTTLIETILASHPSVEASDERDFLANAANELLHGKNDLQQLATLDDDELERWRSYYWDAVGVAGLSVAGKVFVDKVPLNSLRLPLIARLFPSARIVLAIRDPRDVVLSSFRHRFNMSPASFEFLRLDDCARFYDAVMNLVDSVRENAPFLQVCAVRYEDMIDDFDRTVETVCNFVGIEWAEAMRQFQDASPVIDRRSQSAAQVRRGLYRGAAGQWRHYEAQLAPVLPILAPWIGRFEHPQDQPDR
jgi:tetratricopeptide (TPR) repeat protein